MSLFHNPREIRVMTSKKRKKPCEDGEAQISYSCDLCDDEYDSETELHLHRKSKHKPEVAKMLLDEMVCKACIKKHESYESLIKHIKTQHLLSSEDSEHVEREIFVCNICQMIYFNKAMLAIHIQYSHDRASNMKATTQCPKCSKFIQVRNAWFHFQRHLTQSLTSCPLCLQNCINQKDLDAHVATHPCYYRCNICQYDASNKNYFNTHMQAHNTKEVCNVLNKVINNEENVLKHCFIPRRSWKRSDFNASLRGFKLFNLQICVLCRAICTEATKLDHILRYHVVHRVPEKKKQYACLCGAIFFNNILLRHHVFKMKCDDEHRPCDMIVTKSDSVETESSVNVTLLVEKGLLPGFMMAATENVQ